MLTIEHLSIAFGGRRVVDDVSLSVSPGETLAVVGESGSGKSLTALSALRLLPATASVKGVVTVDGTSVLDASETGLRRVRGGVAGMVFQEPMTSLNPLHRIGRQVGEAMQLHGRKPAREAVVAQLNRVGFPDAVHRLDAFPYQLSGGQRQRVMIAIALANDPKLLIADEPTTALDVTIQAGILDLLAAEKRRRGLALLLISHDLNVVRRVADRVAVMKDGKLLESGPAERVFRAPRHPYTRALIDAEPSGSPAPVAAGAAVVAEVRDLGVEFAVRRGLLRRTVAHVRAVDGVSFAVREGETLGLVGESGSGKSTIGLAMLHLTAAQGQVLFAGQDLASLRSREIRALRREMQIVFQDPYGSLSPRMSVEAIVEEGLRVHEPGLDRAGREARVRDALEEVGLPADAAHRYPHEFSGGQRQRVAVARAIVVKPRLLVLDEPTSALDRTVQSQLIELLRRVQAAHGLAYLFISHDLAVVRALAHRVIVLQAGRVVEEGPADLLFERPQTAYAAALIEAAFPRDAAA